MAEAGAVTGQQENSFWTWIMESIKRHLYRKNCSVTHQSSVENNMPENKGILVGKLEKLYTL